MQLTHGHATAGNLLLSVSSRFTGLDTVQQIKNFAHVRF